MEFYVITQIPINGTQRGIGKGTACDMLGYGARGSDGQVIYILSFILNVRMVNFF